MPLPPSQVRRRILDEHTRISGWLAEIEHLAGRLRAGENEIASELRRRAHEFQRFFLSHLSLEEAILVPALERAGDRGPGLAQRLVEEHGGQREALREFAHELDLPDVAPETLANQVDAFVRAVRIDMQAEEALDLRGELLNDAE